MPLRSNEVILAPGLVLKEPKGNSKRTIPMPPELVQLLRRRRKRQNIERIFAGSAWVDLDPVFATATGTPIYPRDDLREFKVILALAGVADFQVHDGRHTAGTMLLALGIDISVVQEILGHCSDVRVTRGYVHVASEMAKEATQRIGSALLGGVLHGNLYR